MPVFFYCALVSKKEEKALFYGKVRLTKYRIMNIQSKKALKKEKERKKKMKVDEHFLKNNPCFMTPKRIEVKGLMLHSVGCPQPSAEVFVRQFDKPDMKKAVHAFIDGHTGTVWQTLPWEHRAWHCGGDANSTHIGVEMCEPPCIKYTGGTAFTCENKEAALEVVRTTYIAAVELFAYLCIKYSLDPLAKGVIISHKEGHDRGVASGHGDPEHLWQGIGCAYTMDGFRASVKAEMEKMKAPKTPPPMTKTSVAPPPPKTKTPVAPPPPMSKPPVAPPPMKNN